MMSRTGSIAGDCEAVSPNTQSILFVCMGNICRSPLAKAMFIAMATDRGVQDRFRVDSCGTGGWHAGESADPRTIAVAKRYGVPLSHRARQLAPLYDFTGYDLIVAMDRRNVSDIISMGGEPHRAKIRLMRGFDAEAALRAREQGEEALDVPDPYYGGADGFDQMYHIIRAACDGLLDSLLARPGGGSRADGLVPSE